MRKWIIIGALAVVIVFAAWWFWPLASLDCSDVEKKDTGDVDIYTIESEPGNIPLIQDWKQAVQTKYRMWYETPGGGALKTYFVDTLDELEDGLDTLNIDPTDKKQAQLIIDCIRAGCPGCA